MTHLHHRILRYASSPIVLAWIAYLRYRHGAKFTTFMRRVRACRACARHEFCTQHAWEFHVLREYDIVNPGYIEAGY